MFVVVLFFYSFLLRLFTFSSRKSFQQEKFYINLILILVIPCVIPLTGKVMVFKLKTKYSFEEQLSCQSEISIKILGLLA